MGARAGAPSIARPENSRLPSRAMLGAPRFDNKPDKHGPSNRNSHPQPGWSSYRHDTVHSLASGPAEARSVWIKAGCIWLKTAPSMEHEARFRSGIPASLSQSPGGIPEPRFFRGGPVFSAAVFLLNALAPPTTEWPDEVASYTTAALKAGRRMDWRKSGMGVRGFRQRPRPWLTRNLTGILPEAVQRLTAWR